jgi:hypothetical protein
MDDGWMDDGCVNGTEGTRGRGGGRERGRGRTRKEGARDGKQRQTAAACEAREAAMRADTRRRRQNQDTAAGRLRAAP